VTCLVVSGTVMWFVLLGLFLSAAVAFVLGVCLGVLSWLIAGCFVHFLVFSLYVTGLFVLLICLLKKYIFLACMFQWLNIYFYI
jgi:hypothetical protein